MNIELDDGLTLQAHPAPAARDDQTARRGRGDAGGDRPPLQHQPGDDFHGSRREVAGLADDLGTLRG
jgi:hypothetical protein